MRPALIVAMGLLVTVFGTPLVSLAEGIVTGKVTYNGKAEEKEFVFSKFPNSKFCSKNPHKELVKGDKRIMPTIRVGTGGALRDAVVAVTDIEDQAFMDAFEGTKHIGAFCEWLEFTGIVVKKKNFHVENHDADPDDPKSLKGVLHNPHAFETLGPSSTTVFNIALAEIGSKLDKPVTLRKQGSTFRLQCDQHEFMQAFFMPVTNPYYAIANEEGGFQISGVPPGKHRIMAWHPFAGKVEVEIEVKEGVKTQTNLEIKK
jgi:hypothetical protein